MDFEEAILKEKRDYRIGEKPNSFSVFIVRQDLNGGIIYVSGFTTLEEAQKCRDAWWVKWGRRSLKPTIYEQIIEEKFQDDDGRMDE